MDAHGKGDGEVGCDKRLSLPGEGACDHDRAALPAILWEQDVAFDQVEHFGIDGIRRRVNEQLGVDPVSSGSARLHEGEPVRMVCIVTLALLNRVKKLTHI